LKKAILKQFPIVKVYLKPNIIDMNDNSLDAAYVRSKIGRTVTSHSLGSMEVLIIQKKGQAVIVQKKFAS